MVYPLIPGVSLVAMFVILVVSVGLITSSLSGDTVTTLRGGEILLGLALRGEALLDLDLFPGRGLESWDLEFPPGLARVQSLLCGERPLLGLTARHKYGKFLGENDRCEECIARLNRLFRSLHTLE